MTFDFVCIYLLEQNFAGMARVKSRLKKERYEVPGTLVQCKSGMYLAFYEHRTDIIANGENETDAIKNLKKMYKSVIESEKSEVEQARVKLPPNTKTISFTAKLDSI